jgi:hypothetical protein
MVSFDTDAYLTHSEPKDPHRWSLSSYVYAKLRVPWRQAGEEGVAGAGRGREGSMYLRPRERESLFAWEGSGSWGSGWRGWRGSKYGDKQHAKTEWNLGGRGAGGGDLIWNMIASSGVRKKQGSGMVGGGGVGNMPAWRRPVSVSTLAHARVHLANTKVSLSLSPLPLPIFSPSRARSLSRAPSRARALSLARVRSLCG